jgi:fatty acid desaturase
VNAHPVSHYARQIRPLLPSTAFDLVPNRLFWLLFHLALVAAGWVALAWGWGQWPGAIVAALVIGHSFAGMAFVGHETLHGAVLRGRRALHLIGGLCFLPFSLSPRLWIAWHNRVHHGNTMIDGVDPDSYPTMKDYQERPSLRLAERYALAKDHQAAGWLTLLIGFTVQGTLVLLAAGKKGYLSRAQLRWAVVETLGAWAFWLGFGVLLGPKMFLLGFLVPLMLGNAVVTAYILTNHSLSPLNEVNDPLLNSLTVTCPKWVNALHLNFGLHVEHHIFPGMSSAKAPLVRKVLLERWPERYQSMPVITALLKLWSTPRIYLDPTTLVDPRTGEKFPTLLPRTASAAPRAEGELAIAPLAPAPVL